MTQKKSSAYGGFVSILGGMHNNDKKIKITQTWTQVLVRTINLSFLISAESYPRLFFFFQSLNQFLGWSSRICMIKPPCFQSNIWINQDAKRKKLSPRDGVAGFTAKKIKKSVLVMWHQQINRPQTDCK